MKQVTKIIHGLSKSAAECMYVFSAVLTVIQLYTYI